MLRLKDKIRRYKMSEIKDLFSGEIIECWKDEDFVYFSLPFVTINVPIESWKDFRNDLIKLSAVNFNNDKNQTSLIKK